jgi:hypothetical protein
MQVREPMGKTNTLKAKSHMIGTLVTSQLGIIPEASYSHVRRHNLMNIQYKRKLFRSITHLKYETGSLHHVRVSK